MLLSPNRLCSFSLFPPKTPRLCRVVLVTSDEMLSKAVKDRIVDTPNASGINKYRRTKRSDQNTIVSNVGEDLHRPNQTKGGQIVFVFSTDKDTIFYKEKIRERLAENSNPAWT